jgi:hypothetical protein
MNTTLLLLLFTLLASVGCQSNNVRYYEATDTSFESLTGWESEINNTKTITE